jgi:hypothetical protein
LRCKKGALNRYEDTVCMQTCNRLGVAAQSVARFMNNGGRQWSFYSADSVAGSKGSLTGLGSTRNIVRIQMKCAAAKNPL